MNTTQVHELLLQSLEHERGGVKVYKAAIGCAQRPDSRPSGRSTSRRPSSMSGAHGNLRSVRARSVHDDAGHA